MKNSSFFLTHIHFCCLRKASVLILILLFAASLRVQSQCRIVINADLGTHEINRHIYGHFSEQLGCCICGGSWVGDDPAIPNVRSIRQDVVEALKATNIPNLRWPGGCFADEYPWKDGIGLRDHSLTRINSDH